MHLSVHRHVFHAGVVTRAVAPELAAIQRQPVDFPGRHLAALKGLRQRAAVIGAQDRQHRHPFAHFQFGLGNPSLARHTQTPEIIRRATVTVDRQQLSASRAFAAIELERIQAQHIDPETDHALGKARLGIEDEVLCPFFSFVLRRCAVGKCGVGEVAIEIRITQG